MATATALMTFEEYASLPDDGTWTELVRGRIVEVPPPQPVHGRVCFRIARILGNFVVERNLGEVLTNDTGVITRRDPDTLRGADVAFYQAGRLPPVERWTGYFAIPPDLVVEVRSPSDRWAEILEKVTEYLAVGVQVVVVLDPGPRSATLFAGDQAPRTLGPDDSLTLPGLLEGFAVRVGSIFE